MKLKLKLLVLLFLGTATVFSQVINKKTKNKAATSTSGIFAEVKTNKGLIVIELEFKKTPVTVANFVALAEGNNSMVNAKFKGKKFFDGLKFHRVIKDFMIQGGDPDGNGSGGPGYAFKDEFDPTLVHDKAGILSMANSGPKTNGSQFFITHKETSWLNNKHTVFGHVVIGMEIVNAIEGNDIIEKVTIKRKGQDALKFDAPKIFATYFENIAADEKIETEKLAAAETLKKKEYLDKYGSVISNKAMNLSTLKETTPKTATGVQYSITKKGNGEKPKEGTNVAINYAGFLEDGTLFDTCIVEVAKEFGKFDQTRASANGYQPLQSQVGKYQFIPGFVEGLNAMSIGDKAIIFIPSNLAYGERGAGNVIPPNSNIIFEVELLEATPKK